MLGVQQPLVLAELLVRSSSCTPSSPLCAKHQAPSEGQHCCDAVQHAFQALGAFLVIMVVQTDEYFIRYLWIV